MSSADDSIKLRPPLLRRSHIALPPSSPTVAAANRHFPCPSTSVDRPHLFLRRSPPGAAENDKIPPPDTPVSDPNQSLPLTRYCDRHVHYCLFSISLT
ncbi:hypothetical protein BHE74_00040853 [Ensete ventricosum]|uniref:Uncharacterized protein n=1 Tax=Ensete ventricosum TaxID=4639 RepID=A0A444CUR8_ENSVE|nr:hypothetical protein B296_00006854 [Ensete ventricosum]RWV89654.1 hypothetical protein GW17_00048191 [Ensete ventricosum]RWW52713.1 hypothetical protein BHE74_00040853 [Ensete ventricosum]RZR71487.1 hypothetical protein BHM03_00005397 [Ensete ventricosum]